jgi:RNA-dependent RNA polymerase
MPVGLKYQAATYSKATLNRQAILLMEALGVSKDTLLQIFRAEKRSIEGLESGFSPERLAAVTTVREPICVNHLLRAYS